MTRLFATLILLASSFTSANAAIPAGSLDPEFGVEGRRMFLEQVTASSFLSHPAQTIQPDGKRLVAGSTGNQRGYGYVALARFLPTGQLDAEFGTAGMVTTDLGDSAAHGIGLLPDGKIVVLATKAAYDGYALIRYNDDGTLDSTFGTEGVALRTISHGGGSPLGLVVYPSGKTVVAMTMGGFLSLFSHGPNGEGNPEFATAPADLRFNGFNAMESYKSILLQPDGKIVIGGLSENTSAPPLPIRNFGLLRLNPDGSLDTTFNGSGRLTTTFGTTHIHKLGGMALGSDGKLVMAGTTGSHVFLARYLPNGMLDTSLGGSGKVIVTPGALNNFDIDPIGVAIQAEGKIVLSGPGGKSGIIGPTKFCLTRLLADGTLDSNFAGNGFWIPEEPLSAFFAKDILCDTDGRILLAGSQSFDGKTQMTVYRLNADGPLDTSFDNDGYAHAAFQTGLNSPAFKTVAELPDGKIIVAGESLSRLLADGTLDTSFGNEGLATPLHNAEKMLLQTDGKIVIAATTQSPADIVLSRYLIDGSCDTTFGTDGQVTLNVSLHEVLRDILLQPDGKIIVAGSSGSHFITARLLSDGTLDHTFGDNGIQLMTYFPAATAALGTALQTDGKILRSGRTWDGEGYKACLIRLNSDGSLDTTFNGSGKVITAFGTDDSAAYGVAVQPDGNILATGYASANSGSASYANLAVARYLPDGSLDTSFNSTGIRVQALDENYDAANHILLQTDGKIILVGRRTEQRNDYHDDIAIVRLTSSGQLDKTFNGTGIRLFNIFDYPSSWTASNDIPQQPILQRDEKILLPFSSRTTRSSLSFTDYGLIRVLTETRVPIMEVRRNNLPLADGTASLDFGITHNRTIARQTLEIRNVGEEDLRLSPFTFTGSQPGDFKASSQLTIVAPGTSKEIQIEFSPKGPGTRTAELALASNDPQVPSFRIALTGSAAALEFATNPQPQLAIAGKTATLSATMKDVPPVTFEWIKNGKKIIRNTDLPRLTFSPVKTSDTGRYSMLANNDFIEISSSSTFLGVLAPAPASVVLVQGRTLILNARVTAPTGALISYSWLRRGEPLEDMEHVSGSADKTLKITGITAPESDTYTCRITMNVDGQSATLTHGDTEVTVLEPPSLAALTFTDKYVGEPVTYPVSASNHPSLFTATGLPPGMAINKQTGLISGSPTTAKLVRGENVPYKVTITVSNAAGKDSKSADWNILPLPMDLAGSYYGLVARESSLNRGLGGSFKLTVQPSASFSGQLTLEARKYAFTGKLEVASNGSSAKAAVIIRNNPALTDLNLTFTLQPATGELAGAVAYNGSEDSAQITAKRSPWSKSEKPDSYVGTYNAALHPLLPEAKPGIYPEGEGHATVKITPTGAATWSGRLGDGSSITGSTYLVQGGQVALHGLFYKNTSSVQGWNTFSSPGQNLDGTLDWVKLNVGIPGKERTYRHGFPLHTLTVVGGIYTPPPAGELLPDLAATPSNVQIAIICADALEPFSQSFSLTTVGKVTVPPNNTRLKLQFNAKTGFYSGSFSLTDPDPTSPLEVKPHVTRAASFSGAIIQRLGRGAGYSLVPKLPARTGEKTTQTRVLSGSASVTKTITDN